MIAQCANPQCTARLQLLQEGRLFFVYPSHPILNSETVLQYVWLCGSCCLRMTVDRSGKVLPQENASLSR
jgi:hypothetical protein